MKCILKKNICLYLISFLINIKFCLNIYLKFSLQSNLSDIEIMHFKSDYYYDICQEWIPSLFSPIFLVYRDIRIDDFEAYGRIEINFPPLSINEKFIIYLYSYIFLEQYEAFLGQEIFSKFLNNKCYLGLSFNYSYGLNESLVFLNKLKENKEIDKKVFSFDKWYINNALQTINTILYLGDIHEDFTNNEGKEKNGIIGSCKINDDFPFWGCSFKSLSINDNIVPLINKNNEAYKIFFSTENYDIFFPIEFLKTFNNATENRCKKESEFDDFLICKELINENNYFNMKLINDDMNITVEIDSINRFSKQYEKNKNKIRIKFSEIDYFIFPLIMFKNFHVQFDAENKIISFYTTD